MSQVYVLDIPQFRIDYPEFESPIKYPDELLERTFSNSDCYIDNYNYGWLSGDCRYKALTLMTAHLLHLASFIPINQVPGLMQGATIDKISVSLTPPPLPNQFQWWVALTPYGQQLLAMLQVKSVGGFYIGGLPEKSAFRKVGGIF